MATRHEARRRGRPAGVQGRAHRQEALRHRVLAARGRARLDELRLCAWSLTARRRAGETWSTVVTECLAAGLPRRAGSREGPRRRRAGSRSAGRSVRRRADHGARSDRERSGRRGPGRRRRRRAAHPRLAPRGRHPRHRPARLLRSVPPCTRSRRRWRREREGADWVVFGPVYDTASKRQYGAAAGSRAAWPRSRRAVRLPSSRSAASRRSACARCVRAGAARRRRRSPRSWRPTRRPTPPGAS